MDKTSKRSMGNGFYKGTGRRWAAHAENSSWEAPLATMGFLLFVFAVAPPVAAQTFPYVMCYANDVTCTYYPDPSPVPALPPKGVPFTDPHTGVDVVRVTDPAIDGVNCPFLLNIYSTYRIENADHSMILISCGGLYDANTFELIAQIDLNGGSEPRWDPEEPNLFHYRNGMQLRTYDVRTHSSSLVHDFNDEYPGGETISMDTKGEPTRDGRFWAFKITEPWSANQSVSVLDWIIYDMETDTTRSWNNSPAGQDTPAYNAKWIGISPYGNYLLMKNTAGRYYVAPANFGVPRMEFADNSHADWGLDKNAVEVLVSVNDVGPSLGGGTALSMTYPDRVLGGEPNSRVFLLRFRDTTDNVSYRHGFHISANNYERPGWAQVSTYGSSGGRWMDHQLYIIELDEEKCTQCAERPRVWRTGGTYNQDGSREPGVNPVSSYWMQAFATISRDGTRVYWGSNWYSSQNFINLFAEQLPAGWWDDLGSGILPTEDTTPPAAPTGLQVS